jgi:Pyruvate/2-oxoacid:ferredoxin oxidoreductase delta subunit
MTRRSIVRIDEEKCNGCGLCVPACAEGAIQIIDGKARLVSDVYCDGLGACLGECPQDAISIEEREAEAFDPEAVEGHLVEQTDDHNESGHASHSEPLPCGCPGTTTRTLQPAAVKAAQTASVTTAVESSALRNWPVQLRLVPIFAPYLNGARLLIAADCVPFALADFHKRLLEDRVLLIGCPKLDDTELCAQKLAQIFAQNDIKSIDVAFMEVPCCFGLVKLVQSALTASGKQIPFKLMKVSVDGSRCDNVTSQEA